MPHKRIKIVYLVSTLQHTGPTNQLYNIISNLDKTIFDAVILTLSAEKPQTLIHLFIEAKINIVSLNLSRLAGIFTLRSALSKKLAELQPDIVHCQGIRGDYYSGLFRDKIKIVSTLRVSPFDYYPMTYGKLIGGILAKLQFNFILKHHKVVAVSYAAQLALEPYPITIDVIQNGCDTNLYFPVDAETKSKIRRSLNIPEDKKIMISVGKLSTLKDPLTIVRAFRKFSKKDDYHLIFVGEGPLMGLCESETKTDINIHFKGSVTNVDQFLKCADLYISASTSEGLPNAVLEAMACGLPVILSSIPQHMELFKNSSADIPFFEIKDENALLSIFEALPVANSNAAEGLKIIEENFSAKQMSLKYQSLYQQMMLN